MVAETSTISPSIPVLEYSFMDQPLEFEPKANRIEAQMTDLHTSRFLCIIDCASSLRNLLACADVRHNGYHLMTWESKMLHRFFSHITLISTRNMAFPRLLTLIINLHVQLQDFPIRSIQMDDVVEFMSTTFIRY